MLALVGKGLAQAILEVLIKVLWEVVGQALVKERMKDWREGLCKKLDKKLVELTGDFTPDMRALLAADVIIATPEKWDGITRSWASRAYARKVGLLIIDEIHLLGADRYCSPPSSSPLRNRWHSAVFHRSCTCLAMWLSVRLRVRTRVLKA